uniref:SCP domain-containing protein n=1 Tax=Angiostrongylus cantonensis TaxID=6313 RepID=A0A0K0DRC4_ANGCA
MNLNDRDRTDLLNFVNDMRSYVALGDFEAQNLSSAGDMNKLRWDCGLESLAEQVIADCPENPPLEYPTNGVNYRFYGRNTSFFKLRNSLRAAVLEWTSIEDMIWSTSNLFDGNPASRDAANAILYFV